MTNGTPVFFQGDQENWTSLDQGMKRRILGYDDHVMMVEVFFPQGAIGYEHSHPHSQTTYVANGVFEVTVDGQTTVLKEGDSFFVPSGNKHSVVNQESGVLIDVFSPKRDDFLK